jgi:hypothetical protein
MSMTETLRPPLAVPTARQIAHLAIGGFAGLGFWEAFAAVPTPLVAGFPLQPPELVKALFSLRLGVTPPDTLAHFLHYLTGFLLYPLGYFALTRFVAPLRMPLSGWVWGVITYFIALGVLAPLAGFPFLLSDVPLLSFMSLVGHAIYGWLAAWVFERLEATG